MAVCGDGSGCAGAGGRAATQRGPVRRSDTRGHAAVLHEAGGDFLWDFRKEFQPARREVPGWRSPYPHRSSELESHADYVFPRSDGGHGAAHLLPQMLAEWIFVALSLAAPALALRLLGVRDWR